MSTTAETLYQVLEEKINCLLKQLEQQKDLMVSQQETINLLKKKLQQQNLTYERLKYEYDTLKVTQAITGNDEYKHIMKLKINNLVKEIETCMQLVDYKTI